MIGSRSIGRISNLYIESGNIGRKSDKGLYSGIFVLNRDSLTGMDSGTYVLNNDSIHSYR